MAIKKTYVDSKESLHKNAVKKPYRASNKREPTGQMIRTVGIIMFCYNIIVINGY